MLLTNTTLSLKTGKLTGEPFRTNIGIPQGDGLSPKLFTFYLDQALRRIDNRFLNSDHDRYCLLQNPMPLHIEYADDVDFIIFSEEEKERLMKIVEETREIFNLKLNSSKTEITKIEPGSDLTNVKKLGSILDDSADISRRNQICAVAMKKYQKFWKNPYLNIPTKTWIYYTFVKSIFAYICSTWHLNKVIRDKIDIMHRKHLRKALNIKYPKTIKNETLYDITKSAPFSETVIERQNRHLGHLFRRQSTAKDILRSLEHYPRRKGTGQRPANLFKSLRKRLKTDDILCLEDLAIARKL